MKIKEVEVKIMGKEFIFNIPANLKTEEFLEIVSFVESKIDFIKTGAVDLDSFRLGLLTSINIAEEYFTLKRENEKLRKILNKIDDMLAPEDQDTQVSISFSS